MILWDLRNNNLEKNSKGLAAVLINIQRGKSKDLGDVGCRKIPSFNTDFFGELISFPLQNLKETAHHYFRGDIIH